MKRATLNSLSIPEYNLALCRMIKDDAVPNDNKPFLISHLEELNEDAIKYDWATAVRPWSEEIFCMVAENRLPAGWASTDRIQMLRISSRIGAVKTSQMPPKEQFPNTRARNPGNGQQQEFFRGGPPCPQFNSQQGCSQQSGNVGNNGKRLVHVCSFCLMQSTTVNMHSEAVCRNKARQNQFPHF